MKILMVPEASSLGIGRVVEAYRKYLPAWGVEFVNRHEDADLVASHAATKAGRDADVAHCHGLYPTATLDRSALYFQTNAAVIDSIRHALAVTVPSKWVAEPFQRDMGFTPYIIPHGISIEGWPMRPGSGARNVLWAKGHNPGVCDSTVVNQLAEKLPNWHFVTTFGDKTNNVKVIGPQPFQNMKIIMAGAGLYLATAKETFGIQTLEAMATGIPVVGYNWGGTADIIQHGITGYLAKPGDVDDLAQGIEWAWEHKVQLASNAREAVKQFSWDVACEKLFHVYQDALIAKSRPNTISVIIPCYNYGSVLGKAIESVQAQTRQPDEIIVVDDGSTDNTAEVAAKYPVKYIHTENVGVAFARNTGIWAAKGNLVACLDADDYWKPVFLEALAPALEQDRSLGITYGGLGYVDDGNNPESVSAWPPQFSFQQQAHRHDCVPSSCLFRKEAWRRAGGYRPQYTPAEDAELWLRITALGYGAQKVVEVPVYTYWAHSGSLSRTNKEPDWVADKPYSMYSELAPFAAPKLSSWSSNPFRNYDEPWVSVVIPVGPGHENVVWKALDSLQAQTMPYWEAIVVLDCGCKPVTQPTTGQPLEQAYPFIKVLSVDKKSGIGPGTARNMGAKAARASLLVFLDADDKLLPDYLLHTIQTYNDNPGTYVYTDWYGVNGHGLEKREAKDFDCQALRLQALHPVTALVPADWHTQVGGFDEQLAGWEDWDYYLKHAKAGHCGMRLGEHLMVYDYTSGLRREDSLSRRDELLPTIRGRYKEADMGCSSCGSKARASAVQRIVPERNGASMAKRSVNEPVATDMVTVMDNTGNTGAHSIIGARTHQNYGRVEHGERFLMHEADQRAQPRLFILIEAVAEAVLPTVPDVRRPVVNAQTTSVVPASPSAVLQHQPEPEPVVEDDVVELDISLLNLVQIKNLGLDAETAVDALAAEKQLYNRQDVIEYLQSLIPKRRGRPPKAKQ